MKFTPREIKMLNILLEGSSTAKDLAESLDVSRRTVLRDLPKVSKKLKTYDIILNRKTGLGISLVGKSENIKKLKEQLTSAYTPPKPSPEERQHLIILSLLEQKEPQKLLSFAIQFQVSEATISYDLDASEHLFSKYNLKLMRRPGVGVWVEGSEKSIRQLVTDLFYKNFDEGQLIKLLKDKLPAEKDESGNVDFLLSDEIKNRLLKLVDTSLIQQIEIVLKEILDELKFPLADSAYVGLMVHIALAMERLMSGELISMEDNILTSLKNTEEFKLAQKLAKNLEASFSLKIPEEEMGYITMHLLGAKLRTSNADEFFPLDNFEAANMAREILTRAGNELGVKLDSDIIALEGLILHLKPTISRLKLGMDIRNPLLPQLKQDYKELMKVAGSSVGGLQKKYGLKVPESEVGYIAMHIGAALERKGYKEVPVILACASGIGSAQMLASRLQKELPQLNIIDVISLLDIKESIEKYPYVNTIITTVPFESDKLHVIQVSPLLDETDVEKVKSQVEVLEKTFVPTFSSSEYKENHHESQVILDLVEGFVLKDKIIINNKDKLLNQLMEELKDDIPKVNIDEVLKDLKTREKAGGYAVPGQSLAILHTRTQGVKKPFFGVYRLQKSVQMQNMDGKIEDVDILLVMLLPEKTQPEAVNIMGKISIALLENSRWIQVLKKGSGTDILKELVKITR